MTTGTVWVSVVFLGLYFARAECFWGSCWEGCLYSVYAPNCTNGGSNLRYHLDPTTNNPSSLDMCGTGCDETTRTKLYILRQPSSGSQVVTIRIASHCRYALATVNGTLQVQMITVQVNKMIPSKFLFKRKAKSINLTFKSVSAPRLYIALASPNRAVLSTIPSGYRNNLFKLYNAVACNCRM